MKTASICFWGESCNGGEHRLAWLVPAINDGGPTWKNHAEIKWQVARWVQWYNPERLRGYIGTSGLPALQMT